MENKTAVDWLEQQLFDKLGNFTKGDIEQAKEMEKQQFVDFFMWFRNNGERYLGLSIEQFVDEFYKQKFK